MKLWMIEVCEYWDDRYYDPKDKGHLLGDRVWISKSVCQDCANALSVASDHNSYTAVQVNFIIFDWRYIRYQIPKKIRYWFNDTWFKIRMSF